MFLENWHLNVVLRYHYLITCSLFNYTFNFKVDEEAAFVIDHINYDVTDEGQHTKLAISSHNLIDAPVIVGEKKNIAPLLYQGTGLLADPENPLVLPLLTADSTAYSYNPEQVIKEVGHSFKYLYGAFM